ncbi:SGNH hydrolase superfamily [Sesbania bispinosa]|nr:SGNH hydrolase superfamily [Sesbania bispinosa]
MAEQLQQFETVHGNISHYLNDTAEATINKSLFLISVGSNDIFEFFFNLTKSNPINNITLEVQELMTTLMGQYQAHLQNLLNLGARKFGILSVPPLGCVPILRANTSDSDCVHELNAIAELFHPALDAVLQNLTSQFPGMKYSLGNTYLITYRMIDNPSPFRLDDVKSACCGNQTVTDGVSCSPEAQVCENRSVFLFWDQYHPTEYACKLAAITIYRGGSEYVAPTNFSLLVQPS